MTNNVDLSAAEAHAYLVVTKLDPETRAKLEAWLTPVRRDSAGTPVYSWQQGNDET